MNAAQSSPSHKTGVSEYENYAALFCGISHFHPNHSHMKWNKEYNRLAPLVLLRRVATCMHMLDTQGTFINVG